jgi:hypothetical protein
MRARSKIIICVLSVVCAVVILGIYCNQTNGGGVRDSTAVTLSLIGYNTNQSGVAIARFSITNGNKWPIICSVVPPWVEGDERGRYQWGGPPSSFLLRASEVGTNEVLVPSGFSPWRARVVYYRAPSRLRTFARRLSGWLSRRSSEPVPMPEEFFGYSEWIQR